MRDDTTELNRLRFRLLATAYCNANMWTQRCAYITDQAVAILAQRDAEAAERLATALLNQKLLTDTEVLTVAAAAGFDTSTWPQRRARIESYAREAVDLRPHSDPATEAKRVWASLYHHYPQIAAALAEDLTALPPTWREDLFTTSDNTPAHRAPSEIPGPETAPYDPMAWEDCEACTEAQDQCRYHRGFFDGQDYQSSLIKTLLADDTAMDHLQERHAELEARRAQTAATPTPEGGST